VTSDSIILDRCGDWLNLTRRIVDEHVPGAWRPWAPIVAAPLGP
jgi:hypothetical protein